CVDRLGAARIGHGVTAAADAATVALLAERGVALEICPTSYTPFGISELAALPIRLLLAAGVPVALGSDDPLLFRSGLTAQYATARDQLGLPDTGLATLARHSITASAAPPARKHAMLSGVDAWLAD